MKQTAFFSFIFGLLALCGVAMGQQSSTYLNAPSAAGQMEAGKLTVRYAVGLQQTQGLKSGDGKVVLYPTLVTRGLFAPVNPKDDDTVNGLGLRGQYQVALHVVPNPVTVKAEVRWALESFGVAGDITVYNLLGEAVLRVPVPSGEHLVRLNVHSLPNGIYFVRLRDAQGVPAATTRFILNR